MKIAHWNQRFYPLKGGVESHIAAIVNGMKEHQFEIITNLLPNTSKREKYLENATIIRFPPKDYFRAMKKDVSWKINYPYSATAEVLRTKRQKQYLDDSDCDLVHLHDVDSSLMRLSASTGLSSLGKLSDAMYNLSEIHKPILMTKHFLYSESLPKQYREIELQLLNQMDGIICVSKKIENKVREMVPDKNIWHIPNFVDTDKFKPLNPDKRKQARELMSLENKLVGIFVGRITEGKGLDMLLNAWISIVNNHENAMLLIVGGGPRLEEYKIMTIKNNIQNNVMFVGFSETPEKYFQAADFFIQSSESEGLSISLLEAMACGLPVVATDVGGTSEVVSDGKNGWLVDSGSVDSLIQKIKLIIESEDVQFLRENSRELIISSYEVRNNIRKIEELYTELVSQHFKL